MDKSVAFYSHVPCALDASTVVVVVVVSVVVAGVVVFVVVIIVVVVVVVGDGHLKSLNSEKPFPTDRGTEA